MSTKRRIVFLYMVPETGHHKAAEAVMKAASQMNPQVECVGIDAGNQAYPLIGNVFNRMYLQMLKVAPSIWDYLYDNPDVEEFTREMRELFASFSSLRTRKILRQYHPEAVVCTQAMPAFAMIAHKRKGHLRVPLICIVTDFGVHAYWYHDEVDLYLVGHEDVKKEMIEKGIPEGKIRVTGIPIDPRFGESTNASAVRLKMKLHPNKKLILVMGGSHGLGSLDEVVESLKTIPTSFQAVVVCGQNRRLQKKIMKSTKGHENFFPIGYSKDLSALMGAADILITKPGGLTISEAMAKQLPMILTNPLPGQEERNVQFLTRHGVAKLAGSREELIHLVSDLLRHPKKIAAMKQRARLVGKPYSAWEAARSIFSLIHRN